MRKYTVHINENSDQRHLDNKGCVMDQGVEIMDGDALMNAIYLFRLDIKNRSRRLVIEDHEGVTLINEDREQLV